MNLWIRSQDREKITKVNSVNISEFQDSITICGSIDGINLFSLASYKTKERALEVLDEINNIKWYKYMAELSWDNFIKTIYAMPQSEMTKLFLNMNTYEMPKE